MVNRKPLTGNKGHQARRAGVCWEDEGDRLPFLREERVFAFPSAMHGRAENTGTAQ